jgi:heme oxygenase
MDMHVNKEAHDVRSNKLEFYHQLIRDMLDRGEYQDALSLSQYAYAIAITATEREATIDFIADSFDGLDIDTKNALEKNRNWQTFVNNIAATYNRITGEETAEQYSEAA